MSKIRKLLSVFLVLSLLGTMFAFTFTTQKADAAYGDRITASGTQFFAGGSRIWINGCNTPWNAWNDFGGSYNSSWWSSHFQTLKDNKVNAVRVWITCNGEVGINIASDGTVSGATSAHWSNLDDFFSIAQSKGIYIMATLLSFDHFKNYHSNYMSWRNMINNDAKIDSFVNNYVVPFVNRYKTNNYLWSIDICNEIDWVYESAECGNISWARIQKLIGKAAVAIHANSSIQVTVGMGMIKYNSDATGMNGNKVSDSALQAQVADSRAKLDFYSPHYYDWMKPYWGDPFYKTPVSFGLTDTSKPAMIGETPGNGTSGQTLTSNYESGYQNGWQGAMAWTSNGVDQYGSLSTLTPATNAFYNNHASLVYPGGSSATSTPTPTPNGTATPTPTPGLTNTPTPTPAAGSFVKGVNFNGNAVTVDGNNWLSYTDAKNSGLSTTTVYNFTSSLTPNPAVDSATSAMLNSAIYYNNSFTVNQTITNGTYQVYLWVMENNANNSRSFNVKMEGTQVATGIGSMLKNAWVKYGPYNATVSDGTLNVEFVKVTGDPHIMGMEIFTSGGTATPTPTPTPAGATATPTPTPAATATPTPTPAATATPTPTPSGSGTIYEAETATLAGSYTIYNDAAFSGGQKVSLWDNTNSAITWSSVDGGIGGSKSLDIKFRNGNTDTRKLNLYVNGTLIKAVNFVASGSTIATVTETITLNSGTNTIKLQANAGTNATFDVDCIVVK